MFTQKRRSLDPSRVEKCGQLYFIANDEILSDDAVQYE